MIDNSNIKGKNKASFPKCKTFSMEKINFHIDLFSTNQKLKIRTQFLIWQETACEVGKWL